MAGESIPRGRFIGLGGALGVSVAGASLLASCGGSGGSGSEGNGGGGGETGGGEAIAQASEVEPGSAVKFQNDGDPAVLVHLENGDFVAYSAVCTHQGCEVSYEAEDGLLNCPCHGSAFDPDQGAEPTSGPAQQPLSDIPVNVRNGSVVRA